MEDQKQYKYTLSSNNGLLSKEQRNFFETNGFIVIGHLIDEYLLDQFKYFETVLFFINHTPVCLNFTV